MNKPKATYRQQIEDHFRCIWQDIPCTADYKNISYARISRDDATLANEPNSFFACFDKCAALNSWQRFFRNMANLSLSQAFIPKCLKSAKIVSEKPLNTKRTIAQ